MVVMEGPIPDRSLYTFPAFPAEGELSTWHLGFFQKDFAQDLVRGHERELVKGFIEQYLAVDGAFDDRDYEFYARYLREPGRYRAWMDMYQALHTDIAQNEKFREAGLLRMPVLAVGGEEASAAPWEHSAGLRRRCRDSGHGGHRSLAHRGTTAGAHHDAPRVPALTTGHTDIPRAPGVRVLAPHAPVLGPERTIYARSRAE